MLGPFLERWLGHALGQPTVTAWAWWTLQWPILVAGLLFAFAWLLYLGPDVEQRDWRLITPGAVTALVVWLVASGGFAFYAARFGSYNKAWGSLSAVVVMLIWLWLTSVALLLGAEVNAQTRQLVAERDSARAGTRPPRCLNRVAVARATRGRSCPGGWRRRRRRVCCGSRSG